MADFARFLSALMRHWAAWVTGGLLAAVLVMGPGLHLFAATPAVYLGFGILAAGLASFTTWRDEARRADAIQRDLDSSREAARRAAEEVDNEPIPDLPDDLYWALLVAQRHRIRRDGLSPDHTGASLNAFWIGETPVSHRDSQWFYDLTRRAEQRALLNFVPRPGGGGPLQIPTESTKILEVSRRQRRATPAPPGILHSARDGQPFSVDLK